MQPFTVRGRSERRRTKRDPGERCQGAAARAARNAARASPHPGGDASAERPMRRDTVTPKGMCPLCRHPRHARHTDTGPKGPGPFGAQGSGDGAVHPRETPRGARRRRYAPADGGPVLFRPDYVDRSARLAVDGLGIPETDPDGRPSAGGRQRVGLGPRGGDEALELGRAHRRGPRLERPTVAARLVLDDDRRAEGLLEGLVLALI